MTISFDRDLGIHTHALTLRSQRAEILAANMANADTPNYKARNLDFAASLDDMLGEGQRLKATHVAHLQAPGRSAGDLLYRVPTQMSLDGNTVEEEQEKADFADNALRYQAGLRFLSSRLQGLMSAIRGE